MKINCGIPCKTAVVLIIVAAVLAMTGCSARTKIDETVTVNSVDTAGNPVQTVTETNTIKAENVSLVEGLAPIMQACIGDIEKEDAEREAKKTLVDVLPPPADCSKATTASGQSSCYTNNTHMAAYTILGLTIESMKEEVVLESPQAFCARQVAAIAKGYHDKESRQSDAWKAAGITGLIAFPTAWVFSRGIDMVNDMAAGQGDQISTGNINVTKSDDPTAGEGGGNGSIGGQSINIGSGASASDQGQALGAGTVIDKNQATTFKDAESNLDGSGNPSGVVLDDRNDGSDNEFGL